MVNGRESVRTGWRQRRRSTEKKEIDNFGEQWTLADERGTKGSKGNIIKKKGEQRGIRRRRKLKKQERGRAAML